MVLSIVDCILLHQLTLKKLPLPPTDQFNLDNVSIKIQYSVKVMIKANQNIFYSVKNKKRMCHAASGEESSVGTEWRRMRKKRMVENVSICIWKALKKQEFNFC